MIQWIRPAQPQRLYPDLMLDNFHIFRLIYFTGPIRELKVKPLYTPHHAMQRITDIYIPAGYIKSITYCGKS